MLKPQFMEAGLTEHAADKAIDQVLHRALVNGRELAFLGIQYCENFHTLEFSLATPGKVTWPNLKAKKPKTPEVDAIDDEADEDGPPAKKHKPSLHKVQLSEFLRPSAPLLEHNLVRSLLNACPAKFREAVLDCKLEHGPLQFAELPAVVKAPFLQFTTLSELTDHIKDPAASQSSQQPAPSQAPPSELSYLNSLEPDHRERLDHMFGSWAMAPLLRGMEAFVRVVPRAEDGSSQTPEADMPVLDTDLLKTTLAKSMVCLISTGCQSFLDIRAATLRLYK